ncbi:MAG: DUF4013 domain-containing protein [Deltaproteobacteria bacterium]|nr:DUF4013 domain-containing protein [Deltaproteobacteria bacterium]
MKIERSFTFAFKGPGSAKKLFLGGLFSLLFFTVFFAFVVVGYIMLVLCNALEGRDAKLPEWTDFGARFNEGLQPVLVMLAYCSPIVILFIVEIQLAALSTFIGVYLLPVLTIIGLIVSVLLPLALIRCVVNGSFKASFEFGKIFSYIKENPGTYFTAWGLSIAVTTAAGLASITVLLGAVGLQMAVGGPASYLSGIAALLVFCFTYFVANIIAVHLYAQAYRASTPFEDDQEGTIRASMAVPPPLRG